MHLKKVVMALSAPFLLTSCLLLPGKFDATLDIRRDGNFNFHYAGELIVADPSPKPEEFVSYGCFDDESGDERECSEQELADQRAEFEQQQASDTTITRMGGPSGDLGSEEGIIALVEQLNKQRGWNRVVYRGNRIIDVDYSVSGKLTQEFAFPVVDGQPGILAFLTLTPRKNGSVKISAPAFSNNKDGTQMAGAAGAMASGAADNRSKGATAEGTFTITTNGDILTNNTDDGPTSLTTGQRLRWDVTARSTNAPEALIQTDMR